MNDMSIILFSETLNITGLIIGAGAFISIALGRYLTIKAEYHFSKKFWVVFLMVGLMLAGLSLVSSFFILSAILSILGFTFLWGIGEIIEQEKRVKKGWFPRKPGRREKSE